MVRSGNKVVTIRRPSYAIGVGRPTPQLAHDHGVGWEFARFAERFPKLPHPFWIYIGRRCCTASIRHGLSPGFHSVGLLQPNQFCYFHGVGFPTLPGFVQRRCELVRLGLELILDALRDSGLSS